ncbi:hypothetical protein [Parasedimentitalea psychrophila]|uniref:Uncharacterized protein n=1 Tax=Parasedimentitalea psychrophila TaxID=2997337 RepID=A0A9Y2P5E0_9RHOB|nr:hypothetical protein [Parasedimentitalea psychrophila]WIY23883.1 hypothetical protein QPJ95_14690 [Parasedimentitalea psychrophila]
MTDKNIAQNVPVGRVLQSVQLALSEEKILLAQTQIWHFTTIDFSRFFSSLTTRIHTAPSIHNFPLTVSQNAARRMIVSKAKAALRQLTEPPMAALGCES